jgi:glycine/D-amino acid oxidase-like deaminating enzyme
MHIIVIGGGMIGLAVARALLADGHGVTVCEKEPAWAVHQTGRNSGVIHSGLYYRPGGLKARLCVAGAASMAAFACERGLPVKVSGKLVVAVHDGELPVLAGRRAGARGRRAAIGSRSARRARRRRGGVGADPRRGSPRRTWCAPRLGSEHWRWVPTGHCWMTSWCRSCPGRYTCSTRRPRRRPARWRSPGTSPASSPRPCPGDPVLTTDRDHAVIAVTIL